jgi:Fe-S-cluster containining protein
VIKQSHKNALARLRQPLLPLARLLQILFLTGPFAGISDVLAELHEPIESQCRYDDPQAAAIPYLDILQNFAMVKNTKPLEFIVVDEEKRPLDRLEALELWIAQQILARELGLINSLLCGAEHCDLCCTGPLPGARHDFFEIPLADNETAVFNLAKIDSGASRRHAAADDQPLELDDQPFYQRKDPALYHWRRGWSLILPQHTACPNLDEKGRCRIYNERPLVCRQPQIFPYLLEANEQPTADGTKVYTARRKLLAIWDCPYVRKFQEEIAAYAELCGLEAIFKENKA